MTKRFKLWLVIIAFAVITVATTFVLITANAKSGVNVGATENLGVAPTINVLVPDEYDIENAPNAVRDLSYNVFKAEAKDVYGKELNVTTKVYLHYDSENKALVGFDGKTFTPKTYGVYTVEYSVTDTYGNRSIKLYDVKCEQKDVLTIIVNSENEDNTALAGEKVVVISPEIKNYIGKVDLEIKAELNGTNLSYDVNLEDGTFTPMYSGEYTIKYTVKDYNENALASYTLTVGNNDNAIFFGDISIPKYLIVGSSYKLPEVKCYHFASGKPIEVKPEISVNIGDYKTVALGADNIFTPNNEGETLVTYTARYNGKVISKVYNTTCVDVNYKNVSGLDMKDYFYVSNGMANFTTLSRGIQINTPINETKIDFIRPIVSERLSVEFGILPESNFERLNIYLTDSEDSNICVKLSVCKVVGDDSLLIINDATNEKVVSETTFETLETTLLSYTNNNRKISVGGSYPTTIYRTLSGERFEGFTSGSVYVSFELEDVIEQSGIVVYKLNNQTMSAQTSDNIEPYVVFYSYAEGVRALGDEITVKRIFVGDVLDPKATVTYYVLAPDKTNVVSIDGITLNAQNTDYTKDYTFKATQLGGYLVYMKAVDSRGNEVFYSYMINVVDKQAPKIVLGIDGDLTGKVNKKLKLRTAVTSDDVSQSVSLTVLVVKPNGVIEVVSLDNPYVPTQAGVYEFWYYAMDEAFNVTMISYKVTVV